MWKPIAEAITELNSSERTIRRKVKTGELKSKKEKQDAKGNEKLFIWIEKVLSNTDTIHIEKPNLVVIGKGSPEAPTITSLDKVNDNSIETQECNNINIGKMPNSEEILFPIANIEKNEEESICQELITEVNLPVPMSAQATPPSTEVTLKSKNSDWISARQEDRDRAYAKFHIIKSFNVYRKEQKEKGINFSESGDKFVVMLTKGKVCVNDFNLLKVSKIHVTTLLRWERVLKASGDMDSPVGLLEGFRYCGRQCKADVHLRNRIRQLSAEDRHLNPSLIYNLLRDEYDLMEQEFPLSERSVQLMVQGFRKEVNTMALGKGKSALRNNVKLHNARVNDLLPGELWESDGHVCNFLVKSPFYCHSNPSKRYLIRPIVIVNRDVATGGVTSYRATPTETKSAVLNSLIDGFLMYGIPGRLRLDNGNAYKNVEFSPFEYYQAQSGKRKLTDTEKIAKQMIERGDYGLYKNMGIKYEFCIPGNPESKSIEAFWNYGFSIFEKSFESWIGNKPENRPEKFRNMDNKTLSRKFNDIIPTWDEFIEKLDIFFKLYNYKPRKTLTTIDGELLSPMEAYNQVEHTLPNQFEIMNKMRYPYIEMRMVQRSMIEKNGILYWHPVFASLIGKKIGIYYDENNLREIVICNEKGQMYEEKAISIDPGSQSGDNLKSMIENNRRVKIGQLCYLSLCDATGSQKIEKMLKIVSKELLPLSNSKQEDEVKYLNFDDALDSIAGTEESNVANIVPMPKNDAQINPDEEEKELMDSLKEDIAGMFG